MLEVVGRIHDRHTDGPLDTVNISLVVICAGDSQLVAAPLGDGLERRKAV